MTAAIQRRFGRIALVAAAAAALAGCGINSVPTAEENAKAKWADVESAYQRRADLVPALVETTKGAAASETQILTNVTNAARRPPRSTSGPRTSPIRQPSKSSRARRTS